MKTIKAEHIPVLYRNVKEVLDWLGASGTLVLTGSGAYVGILGKIDEKDHPIHDFDLKLIPDNPIKAVSVLTALSTLTGKQCPNMEEYFTIKGEPVRYDFMFNDIPVNVWIAIDPVRYEVMNTGPSKFCCPMEIPVENLDDIFIAKAKMNRPKDVRDIENICWASVEYQYVTAENVLHPWVVDSENKLTPAELSHVQEAVVVNGCYNDKAIRFTVQSQAVDGNVYCNGWQYLTLDEHWDDLDKIMVGDVIAPSAISIVKYKRFNGTEEKLRARIEL